KVRVPRRELNAVGPRRHAPNRVRTRSIHRSRVTLAGELAFAIPGGDRQAGEIGPGQIRAQLTRNLTTHYKLNIDPTASLASPKRDHRGVIKRRPTKPLRHKVSAPGRDLYPVRTSRQTAHRVGTGAIHRSRET